MFEKTTPESVGISSAQITKYIKMLEKRGAATHSLLMMRGDKIFTEHYWAPFHKDFCHRMYSQTKSFVAIGIGLLEEDGKLSLDDKIYPYFEGRYERELPEFLKDMTIREMLTMTTTGCSEYWLYHNDPDRIHSYFETAAGSHPAGTLWAYDSAGSQVLSTLVEKLSGMSLLDFLKTRIFNKIGTFQNARVLKVRNDDSWGDSAMICTTRDMASFGRFCMKYGNWNGEQLLNERFLRTATSRLVDNMQTSYPNAFNKGYGYQIWRCEQNGFAFVGMGEQLTVCLPERDFVFVITSDNQGGEVLFRNIIVNGLFDLIVDEMADEPIPEDKAAQDELEALSSTLKLRSLSGMDDSPFRAELNGKKYICKPNAMGITEFTFKFADATKGEFIYKNAQGEKVLPFGVNHNVFGKFPELGYSTEHGGVVTTNGEMYNDAVSLSWNTEKNLMLYAQIIDDYFGNLTMHFAFKDGYAYASFTKAAEGFLETYQGALLAHEE